MQREYSLSRDLPSTWVMKLTGAQYRLKMGGGGTLLVRLSVSVALRDADGGEGRCPLPVTGRCTYLSPCDGQLWPRSARAPGKGLKSPRISLFSQTSVPFLLPSHSCLLHFPSLTFLPLTPQSHDGSALCSLQSQPFCSAFPETTSPGNSPSRLQGIGIKGSQVMTDTLGWGG